MVPIPEMKQNTIYIHRFLFRLCELDIIKTKWKPHISIKDEQKTHRIMKYR